MPTSPLVENMDLVSFDILLNGSKLKDAYDVFSIEVQHAVNTIPSASFVLALPRVDKAFAPSESADLTPGTEVEIKVGFGLQTSRIFKGIITHHTVKTSVTEGGYLRLHCQDKAVKMTTSKKVKVFEQQTDGAILGTLVGDNGLSADVATTTYQHPQLFQTGTTDWDFAVSRAAANGLLLYAEDGKVFAQKPLAEGEADLVLTYGHDVFDFEAQLDAGTPQPTMPATGSDIVTDAFFDTASGEPNIDHTLTPGNRNLINLGRPTPVPASPNEGTNPAADAAPGSPLTGLRGHVSFYGNASPRLNTPIDLAGFGRSINGSVLISSIRHTVTDGNWVTETGFGLSPEVFAVATQAPGDGHGAISLVNGLQHGSVKQIAQDPEGEHRILVTLPALGADVWARQANFYATKGKGSFFLPETGDEVIVGFLDDDPRFAVVLGSVYSAQNPPPYTADEENAFKAIVSREDLKIELNDSDKTLTIATPAGNTVVLSDNDRSIEMKDQHGNSVVMNRDGIELKSTGDITLEASGDISLKGTQGVAVASPGGDVELKGMNVTGDGRVGVKMKGGATAELSAGAQTTVKGAMVMIN